MSKYASKRHNNKRGLKRVYRKNTLRTIKQSILRFLAIMLMTMLGASVFIGLISAGPNMRYVMDAPIEDANREHLRVYSPLGMYPEDRKIIEDYPGVRALSYYQEGKFFMDSDETLVKLFSLDDRIGKPFVTEGRLPEAENEILLDDKARTDGAYALGDTVHIYPEHRESALADMMTSGFETTEGDVITVESPIEEDGLTESDFTVVGFAEHVYYFTHETDGVETIGEGTEDYFGIVLYECFTKERPNGVRLVMDELEDYVTSDKTYMRLESEEVRRLEGEFAPRAEELAEDLKGDYEREIEKAEAELEAGKQELQDAKDALDDAKAELDAGEEEYREGKRTYEQEIEAAEEELADAKRELDTGEQELADGREAYEQGLADYEAGKKELADGERELRTNRARLDRAQDQLERGILTLEANGLPRNTVERKKKELETGKQKLAEARAEIEANEAKIPAEYRGMTPEQIDNQRVELIAQRRVLEDKQATLEAELAGVPDGALEELEAGLAEAEQGLKDLNQLIEAKRMIADGEEQLEAGEKELRENRARFTVAKASWEAIGRSEERLAEREAEYAERFAEVEKAEQELAAEKEALDAKEAERRERADALEAADARIADLDAEAATLNETLATTRAEIRTTEDELAAIEAALAEDPENLELLEEKAAKEQALAELQTTETETVEALEANETERQDAAAAREAAEAAYTETDREYRDMEAAYERHRARVEIRREPIVEIREQLATVREGLEEAKQALIDQGVAREDIPALEAKLDEAEETLRTKRQELEDGKAKIPDAYRYTSVATLEAKQRDLDATVQDLRAKKAQLEKAYEGQAAIEEGLTKLNQGIRDLSKLREGAAELSAAKEEVARQEKILADAEAQLRDGIEAWDRIAESEAKLEAGETEYARGLARYEVGKEELDAAKETLDQAKQDLELGQRDYDQGLAAYEDGTAKLEEERARGKDELDAAWQRLYEGKKKYREGLRDYEARYPEAMEEINEGEASLASFKDVVAKIKVPTYQIEGRYNDVAISVNLENADNIEMLTLIFPLVFYLVAMLVTLTTVTRMVEEERMEIGTFKALGVQNRVIQSKYLNYAIFSSSLGSVIGIVVGFFLLMPIIFFAYTTSFNLYFELTYQFNILHALFALIIGVGLTTFAAWYSVKNTLRAKAATLMRPKSPTKGNRVLLEHVSGLWKRLGFMAKVTVRNLTSKKSRMFMTLLGVLGSTALLVMAFGLRASVESLIHKEFEELQHYNAQVIFNPEADAEDLDEIREYVESVSDTMVGIFQSTGEFKNEDGVNVRFNFVVVPDEEDFARVVTLRDRKSGDPVRLPRSGVLVTERFKDAVESQINNGFIRIKDEAGYEHDVEIIDDVETYVGHTMYAAPAYYERAIQEKPELNAYLFDVREDHDIDAVMEHLRGNDHVLFTTTSYDVQEMVDELRYALNIVILMITVISALLAYVVLFNLTNLNVSERLREISTIKVLGFHDREVTQYIYRETFILTLVGILLGMLGGKGIHYLICMALSPENVLIDPALDPLSYLIGSLIIVVFAIIVMLIIHRRLKRIDMVEALKAVE